MGMRGSNQLTSKPTRQAQDRPKKLGGRKARAGKKTAKKDSGPWRNGDKQRISFAKQLGEPRWQEGGDKPCKKKLPEKGCHRKNPRRGPAVAKDPEGPLPEGKMMFKSKKKPDPNKATRGQRGGDYVTSRKQRVTTRGESPIKAVGKGKKKLAEGKKEGKLRGKGDGKPQNLKIYHKKVGPKGGTENNGKKTGRGSRKEGQKTTGYKYDPGKSQTEAGGKKKRQEKKGAGTNLGLVRRGGGERISGIYVRVSGSG